MPNPDKKKLTSVVLSVPLGPDPQHHWVGEKQEVILIRDGERARAFSSLCPHMGAQMCYRSKERQLVCPWHGLAFNIDNKQSNHPKYQQVKEFVIEEDSEKITLRGS